MTKNPLWTILDASPVGIAVFDADEFIIYANPMAEALLGTSVAKADRLRCGDLLNCANRHSDPGGCRHSALCPDCPLFQAIGAALDKTGPPEQQGNETLVERDGDLPPIWIKFKVAPLTIDGQPLAVMVVDDISAYKSAQEALGASELKYRSFFDNSLDALLLTSPDGSILEVNPATCRMFGRTAEEIKRLGRSGMVDMSDPRLLAALERRARVGKSQANITLIRSDRTKFEAEITSTIFTDAAGEQKTSMTIRDLSESEQATQKHKELEDQLHHAQRLESVGRLAGGVSHDFNNLLSVILGYTQMMIAEIDREHPHHELLEEIHQAAVRARDLTRQLLAFSRKQILEVAPTEVNEVVTGFEKLIRRVIGEDIALKLILFEAPLPIEADTAQIEQVLMNLAVNARDAMPQGGALTIETTAVDLDEAYASERPGVVPGRYAMIAVSDTGCGMDPKIQKSIFEPFFTTKEKEKGTGLGLATSYGIIKQHGGNIWVYSEPGHGSTFKIYLPLCRATEQAETENRDAPTLPRGSATILVVEDEKSVRKMACRILTEQGYTVIESRDTADAVARAAAHKTPIDLVLTDVVMPGMRGPEVFERIRHAHPQARVLYMSGYTGNAMASNGLVPEGTRLIQKPFTVDGLLAKVAARLEG